jgi:uncharacterized protein (TIGR02145 family)
MTLKKKRNVFVAAITSLLLLAACDDDSSTSPVTPSNNEQSSSSIGEFVESGFMTDSRDGQSYKIVKIGNQTWMAQNLNYETANSYCYDNDSANCTKYGRLYTWAAAKTACPSGWYLPSNDAWEILFTELGGRSTAGKVLKSTSEWNNNGNGTDAYGFSALPAGKSDDCGYFNSVSEFTKFWSATPNYFEYYAYCMQLFYDSDLASLSVFNTNNGFSVRCLKY